VCERIGVGSEIETETEMEEDRKEKGEKQDNRSLKRK
jgi:hypothetical protein